MTRYDWGKLDAGWRYMHLTQSLMDASGCTYVVQQLEESPRHPVDVFMGGDRFLDAWSTARAQLAKCRIPEPVDTDTRDWQALTEENERLKVDNMRLKHLWRDADLARSISEGQVTRLTEQIRKLQEKPSDWRDEVRQACDGVDGIREPYQLHPNELTVRPTVYADHEAFRLVCGSSREYALFDGVRTIELALKLSIVVERLKKLGWTEAK